MSPNRYTPRMSPSIALQYLLPQKTLSRIVRAATRCTWSPWKNFLIARVLKRYRVDMSEAAQRDPFAYPSFNAFFTRALKPGARHAGGGQSAVLCPADGRISQAGRITHGRILQAKGREFTVAELLGDGDAAEAYHDGQFAVALVGAMLVSGITTVWHGHEVPPYAAHVVRSDWRGRGVKLARFAEMGRFEMGSTVIVLLPKGCLLRAGLMPEMPVRVGQRLGHFPKP